MVERWVVASEVEGSSPSSYPITKSIHTLANLNILLNKHNNINTSQILIYLNILNKYNANYSQNLSPVKITSSKSNTFKRWLKPSFKLFISVSLYNTKKIISPHHTFRSDGYLSASSNGGFSDIKLFFNAYKSFFYLLYSVLYFNVPKLIFTNNIFREEACSINWEHLSRNTFIFRYNYHSIFFRPSKLDDKLPLLFRLFKQSGIASAFIIDSLYHSKNIYYLHRFNFYTIGFVEGNKPKYTLNTALPSLGDSVTGQLFFIRSLLLIRRITSFK